MYWEEVLPTGKINQRIRGYLLTGKLPQPQPPPCSLKCLSFHNGQICVTSPNMGSEGACDSRPVLSPFGASSCDEAVHRIAGTLLSAAGSTAFPKSE